MSCRDKLVDSLQALQIKPAQLVNVNVSAGLVQLHSAGCYGLIPKGREYVLPEVVSCVTKYITNQGTDFKETLRKKSLDGRLQLNYWSQPNSGWLPHQINFSKHRNGYDSVYLTDSGIQFSLVVAGVIPNMYSKHRLLEILYWVKLHKRLICYSSRRA